MEIHQKWRVVKVVVVRLNACIGVFALVVFAMKRRIFRQKSKVMMMNCKCAICGYDMVVDDLIFTLSKRVKAKFVCRACGVKSQANAIY